MTLLTAADMIAETKRHLYAGRYDPINKLTDAILAADTTISFDYDLGGIAAGAYLGVDLEMMYVWAVTNQSTKTITVERGVLGTTATTHAEGSLVTLNPKFSDFAIFNALNEELEDLSGPDNGLFYPVNTTLTYNSAVRGYDLDASSVIGILRIRAESTGPQKDWPEILAYDLVRSADTTDFASGFQVVLKESGWSGRDVRIEYASQFTQFTASASTTLSTGLAYSASDIPPLGAALRLQYVREGQRNFNEAQPAPRRAAEVTTGAQLTAGRGLDGLRARRIRNERARLRKDYPHKRKLPPR